MDISALIVASALLAVACVVLIAELFLVSFGVLTAVSFGLAIGAVIYAFTASTTVGWIFLLIVPILGAVIVSRGMRLLQKSRLVPKAEIHGDAGYHHLTAALGIVTGAKGVLVTAARPTARARFAGGECDVMCDRSAEAGAHVTVTSISGASVHVSLADHLS